MEVHKILGNGFQEAVYQRALSIEMSIAGLSFNEQFEMPIFYKGIQVKIRRVDFLVESNVSVEIKAIRILDESDMVQAINYLEAV